jgi:hypothetical protein
VQAAITRARVERDIRKLVLLDQIDDDVGLPALGRFFYVCVAHINFSFSISMTKFVEKNFGCPADIRITEAEFR